MFILDNVLMMYKNAEDCIITKTKTVLHIIVMSIHYNI